MNQMRNSHIKKRNFNINSADFHIIFCTLSAVGPFRTTLLESKMHVIISFVRDHDTRFSRDFLHPALPNTQRDLHNTYQPRGKQKQ